MIRMMTSTHIIRQQVRFRCRRCDASARTSSLTPRVVLAAAVSMLVWMLSICVPCSLTSSARSWKISETSLTARWMLVIPASRSAISRSLVCSACSCCVCSCRPSPPPPSPPPPASMSMAGLISPANWGSGFSGGSGCSEGWDCGACDGAAAPLAASASCWKRSTAALNSSESETSAAWSGEASSTAPKAARSVWLVARARSRVSVDSASSCSLAPGPLRLRPNRTISSAARPISLMELRTSFFTEATLTEGTRGSAARAHEGTFD
mmetsp:Transcript_12458/g.40559  ORF Transcript_12458/g.40559 Transcript_12458/m.40559 type:complete len:266 (-) Transcript_12458:46-843(-)